MGCGVSHLPPNASEARPLHKSMEIVPCADKCTNRFPAHPTQIAEEAHENGISSGRPSADEGSVSSTDSPPPRFSVSHDVAGGDGRADASIQVCSGSDGKHGVNPALEWRRSASPVPGLSEYATLSLRHVHKKLKHNHRVFRICLTGGPCAGKSTFLTQLQAKMPQRTGYKVFCVPEAATLLVTGGMEWSGDLIEEQQLALLRVQMALEDQFYSVAMACGAPSIVISDRGTMDGSAFCSKDVFARIGKRLNVSMEMLRDRYDAVIHLVTAACGAREYYNLDNPARYEGIEEAVESDKKLRQVYVGHPMLRIIDNSTTFEEKIERGLALVGQIIGQKFSMRNTSYYLLSHCPKELPVKSVASALTITVLCNSHINDIRLLIRREHPSGECMYFFNSIRSMDKRSPSRQSIGSEGSFMRDASTAPQVEIQAVQSAFMGTMDADQRAKNEQRISSREYAILMRHRDTQRRDVVMNAVQFIHDDARYEVTTILEPSWAAGKQALTLECDDQERETFPSFLVVDREVPIDSLSTAFLIAHTEMGPLYTSLAYAPVFTRGLRTRGACADTEGSRTHNNSSGGEDGQRTPQKLRRHAEDEVDSNKKTVKRKKKKHHAKRTTADDGEASSLLQTPDETVEVTAKVEETVEVEKGSPNRLKRPLLGPINDLPAPPTPPIPPPRLPSGPPTANPRGAIASMH
ncbi:uncharacterized protein Tco025E_05479 [Trypanosoma conorhini]|uniref:NadR/Ttd14 AAA domain-containing protein n=1 Tax=Trypanosoma conorhini TaxID=83891 RepID=A0A422PCW4_9TRYP|nr:uncharacterized protein Tco025E_05479 [Trypanosoma conorhini]RNF15559.1 hypothetical protein Tco025E_05479 [Trypanosoma conorhini]